MKARPSICRGEQNGDISSLLTPFVWPPPLAILPALANPLERAEHPFPAQAPREELSGQKGTPIGTEGGEGDDKSSSLSRCSGSPGHTWESSANVWHLIANKPYLDVLRGLETQRVWIALEGHIAVAKSIFSRRRHHSPP